jgi:predicted RNase H-like nuclease (RuvC/YqgF family)
MDSEEVIREYQRTSRESEARLSMLNKENDELQNKVNELIKEKLNLSKELSKTRVRYNYCLLKWFVDSWICRAKKRVI